MPSQTLQTIAQRQAQLVQSSAPADDLAALTARITKLEIALQITINASPHGNDVLLRAADAQGVNGDGGDLTFVAGAKNGTGVVGFIKLTSLPTANPVVAGALWNDVGVVKVSAG